MQQPRIYESKELSRYYDTLYSYKDYGAEAGVVMEKIKQYKKSSGRDLLEVACGTGKHLQYLKKSFNCTGVDLNPGVLSAAKRNVSGVKFQQVDMINLALGRKFDVITCLFSSIGYVRTLPNFANTVTGFAKHLKPGGVVIIEPWFAPSTFRDGTVTVDPFEENAIKGVRVMRSRKSGRTSSLEGEYLISDNRGPIKHYRDRHEMGLFSTNEQLREMRRAGLKSRSVSNGLILYKKGVKVRGHRLTRGLLIGLKPIS